MIHHQTQGKGRVSLITIDRPERRNAVDAEAAGSLVAAFKAFDADPEIAVAVLTGGEAGGGFCSGADLREIADGLVTDVTSGSAGPLGPTRLRLGKPVIAAIEGWALGGGLELALWCDLRVVGSGATLGVASRRWGFPCMDGATVRLPRLIGHGRALDLLLTGRHVDAQEALSMGLVSRVVDDGAALAEALRLADEIAAHPQSAIRHDRASTLEQWSLSESDALANELRHGADVLRTVQRPSFEVRSS
jgi:enoyl-CoA hydratase